MNRMNRARLIKRSWSISAQAALTIKSRTFHLTGVTPDACWAVARSSAPAWSVRRQHHTGLFPDVVSQLPRQRAPSSMAARRLLRHWPFLAAAIGILFGGWISDRLLKRTGSVNISRKLPIISGLLLSSCIIAANWVSANSTVIIIMSVAFLAGDGRSGLDLNFGYCPGKYGRPHRRHI